MSEPARRVGRIRDWMVRIAVAAAYLAAIRCIRSARSGPARGPRGAVDLGLSVILLFYVLPFHVMAAWERLWRRRSRDP